MAQNKYFSAARIKLQELFSDTYQFLKRTYEQTNNVFSSSSPFGMILEVLQHLIHQVYGYIADSAEELNIISASRPQSIYGLARLAGHNITLANAPTGVISVSLRDFDDNSTKTIFIPNYVRLSVLENGYKYLAVLDNEFLQIDKSNTSKHTSFPMRVFQGEIHSQKFTGTGDINQTYELNLKEGDWPAQDQIFVYVNGERWHSVDSLYDMTYNSKNVVIRPGITTGIDIIFGSETLGAIPPLGSEIFVEYLLTEGSQGDVAKSNLIHFLFEDYGYNQLGSEIDLNDFLIIKMETPVANGSQPEDINLTKMLAPATSRSMVLAQTTNYEMFFRKMQMFSTIKIWTEFDKFSPYVDNIIYCLLVPDIEKRVTSSQNYFLLPIEQFALTNYEKYQITERVEQSGQKIFGTYLYFVPPNFKNYVINLRVKVNQGADIRQIRSEILSNISEYLISFKRIDMMPKSDIIGRIEMIKNVDSLNLDFVSEDVEEFFRICFAKEIDSLYFGDNSIGLQITGPEYDELYEYIVWQDTYLIPANDRIEGLTQNPPVRFSTQEELMNSDFWAGTQSMRTYMNKLMSIKSIREWVHTKFDREGNILFGKDEIPIFRGGFEDRFGYYYQQTNNENKLSPINIEFEYVKESKFTFNSSRNNTGV